MKVTFNPAARAELADAVAFYNAQAAGLGDAFASEIRQTILRILDHPDAGYSVRARVRRRLVLRFPYSVLYSADDERLWVLAVMHHGRDPDYWDARI